MTAKTPLTTRLISSTLCGAVILVCPGLGAYAAAGDIVSVQQVGAPIDASAGVAGAAARTSFSDALNPLSALPAASLNGAFMPAPTSPVVSIQPQAAPIRPEADQTVTPENLRTVIPAEALASPAADVKNGPAAAEESSVLARAEAITTATGRFSAPASRIRIGLIDTLKSLLPSRKGAGELPSAVDAAADPSSANPANSTLEPSRPSDKTEPGAAATKKMMGRYVLASNSRQAGYEMLASASMPIYLFQTFHDMSLMADLSILGTLSSVIGGQLSPLIINSMPLKRALIGLLSAGLVTMLVIGVLANLHVLTIPALFGLMIAFRLTLAGAMTAERTVIPSVLGKNQVAMERLRGTKQSWAEVASVLVQNGAAALVVLLRTAARNLIIAPFFFLAAIALQWSSLKIPKDSDAARLAAWREKAAQTGSGLLSRVKAVFKNFAQQIGLGYKIVMRDPALRASALITTLMVMFNVLTYSILAPTFGKFAIGPGADSSLAAPIMGLIAGLFSFGGLFAGKIVGKHARDVEAKHGEGTASAAEASRVSTMRWLKYGALSFLAVGAMALPLPVIGPLIHLGAHAAVAITAVLGTGTILAMWKPKLGLALAMAPVLLAFPSNVALTAAAFFVFGLLQVVASLKNDSLFDKLAQEKAPADYANAAAFVGAFSMFAGMLGLTALKFLIYGALPFGIPSPVPAFTGLPGIWPFVAIFAGAVLTMFGALHLTRRLDRLTR